MLVVPACATEYDRLLVTSTNMGYHLPQRYLGALLAAVSLYRELESKGDSRNARPSVAAGAGAGAGAGDGAAAAHADANVAADAGAADPSAGNSANDTEIGGSSGGEGGDGADDDAAASEDGRAALEAELEQAPLPPPITQEQWALRLAHIGASGG